MAATVATGRQLQMKRDGLIQGTVGTAGRRGRPQTGDRKESWGRRTWRRTRQPMTRSRGPHAFEPSGAWGTEERPFSWWERVPTGNCARVRLRGGEADDVWLARSQLEISGAKTGANPWWASGLGFGLRCSRCLEVRSYGGRWHRPWKAVVPKNEEADADDEDKDVEVRRKFEARRGEAQFDRSWGRFGKDKRSEKFTRHQSERMGQRSRALFYVTVLLSSGAESPCQHGICRANGNSTDDEDEGQQERATEKSRLFRRPV